MTDETNKSFESTASSDASTDASEVAVASGSETKRSGSLLKSPWLWAGLCALSIAGSGIAIATVSATHFSPEREVKQYFELLEQGKSDRALGLLHATVPQGDAVLLSGDGLKASLDGFEASSLELETDTVESDPNQRTVTASYTFSGSEHQTVFSLRKARTDWLFFDKWEFVPVTLPVATVQAQYSPTATVNDSPSPLSTKKSAAKGSESNEPAWNVQTYPVLPPALVKASYQTEFIKGSEQQQVLTDFTAKSPTISLGAEASDKLTDYVDAQLKDYLDKCADQQVLKPAGCPMDYATSARVRSSTINWDILEYPEAKVTLTSQGWSIEPLRGRAKIALQEQDLDSGELYTAQEQDTFEFRATLKVNGNRVTVTPDAFDYDPNNQA